MGDLNSTTILVLPFNGHMRMVIEPLLKQNFSSIVFFTGAGISAESGIPTYRGQGGIWDKYNWEEVACEQAFQRDPAGVLEFHRLRRESVAKCKPSRGHRIIAAVESMHPNVAVVTQNIDGLHQRAGSQAVHELHGSLWRLRCPTEGTIIQVSLTNPPPDKCRCGAWLRPDIVWFGDALNPKVIEQAEASIRSCDLFIAIGTSGVVWPSAGFPQLAKAAGATCLEINPEPSEMSWLYHKNYRGPAGTILPGLFPEACTR